MQENCVYVTIYTRVKDNNMTIWVKNNIFLMDNKKKKAVEQISKFQ